MCVAQEFTCETLYQCFFIMIGTFLPGGGPNGNIQSPSLVEDEQLWCGGVPPCAGSAGCAMTKKCFDDDHRFARLGFDLSFWIFVVTVAVSTYAMPPRDMSQRLFSSSKRLRYLIADGVVFGIITTSFGNMFSEKQAKETDMTTVCFICGRTKSDLSKQGESFQAHIDGPHNVSVRGSSLSPSLPLSLPPSLPPCHPMHLQPRWLLDETCWRAVAAVVLRGVYHPPARAVRCRSVATHVTDGGVCVGLHLSGQSPAFLRLARVSRRRSAGAVLSWR